MKGGTTMKDIEQELCKDSDCILIREGALSNYATKAFYNPK